MQALPKGITGFGNALGDGVLVEQFKSACYAVARQVHGKVLRVSAARFSSFHEGRMTTGYQRDVVDVLCNSRYPIIAFTRQHPEGPTWPEPPSWRNDHHHFVDCPDLANAFTGQFTVLSAAEVEASATDELIEQLDESEKHWVRYWRACRIGDIVFNNWD